MLSRCAVPGWLFPLYLKSGFTVIEESDFYLDRKTVAEYYRENGAIITDDKIDFIMKRTRGNAYLIIYAFRRVKEGKS